MKRSTRELIPPLLIFVLGISLLALVLEFLSAGLSGQAADSTAVTALSGIITACVPALVLLYRLDTPPRPPDRQEQEPEVDTRRAREAIRKYLDQITGGARWRAWST